MSQKAEDILVHYGIKRRSGRYPWGSGDDPYQHSRDFLGRVEELRNKNFTFTDEKGKTWTGDTAIAKSMGLSTTQFRTELGLATNERRRLQIARVKSLQEDRLGPTEIGRIMGIPESSVRSLMKVDSENRTNKAAETANILKKRMAEIADDNGMLDVGSGVERELNISKEKMQQALYLLEREGYVVYSGGIPQVNNPGQQTTQTVLCPPGTKHSEIYDYSRVHTVKPYISRDGGETFEKRFVYPESLDSKRIKIRYNEEGGLEKDGIVELRRGVKDLSLGNSRYSQVRILVDGTHYIKGMAVYSDNMPDGVDVVFNTNKKKGTPMKSVLKEITKDPDNPFGSAIKDTDQGGQYWYDPKTGEHVSSKHPNAKLGLINKRADEGDWTDWKDALPSQFLGKQSRSMAKKQLDLAKADKLEEYDAICELTNPTIKKHLLRKFASECDAAAVHLQAAALPGQKYHVIIPVNSLKDTEVYAPRYKDGEKLALIRYPHGGTFEIPILTVNNKNAAAKKLLGTDISDAVGINSKVAERLSGADFDGDTVMCIPTHDKGGKVKIASKPPLKGLEGFDPKTAYGYDQVTEDSKGNKHYYRNGLEFRPMTEGNKGKQMGVISNLITDMTLAGANDHELAAAVRHSMVVIDAPKHKLDYRQSEFDNNIPALHKKYQGKESGGAATILSRAKGETSVVKRQGEAKINIKGSKWYDPSRPEGALIWTESDKATYQVTKVNKRTGEVTTKTETRMQKSTNMAERDNAYTLLSDPHHPYPMELVYADYANSMKELANRARVEMTSTGKIAYSKTAKAVYKDEVDSLNRKLNTALLNSPIERAAQRMANIDVDTKLKAEQITKKDKKKVGTRALTKYREELGAVSRKKRNIEITDREWEAIQAGAISENLLTKILANTDTAALRQRATPKTNGMTLSTAKINKIKALAASNYTLAQIAEKMNISPSAVSKYLKGGN